MTKVKENSWGVLTFEDISKPSVDKQLTRDRVVDVLRNALLRGNISPGSRLTERELCEKLNVSRTVVREVVRQLETERLVDVTAHRGVRVAVLSPKRVAEIYALRTELEVLTVRSFISCATFSEVDDVAVVLPRLERAATAGDHPLVVDIITKFLRTMIGVADNRVTGEILEQLMARINMLRILAMNEPGQLEASLFDIGALIDAIVARDPASAERIVRTYVARAGAAALRHLPDVAP